MEAKEYEMSTREANIDRLNRTIDTLNEDATEVHELLASSAEELKKATAASRDASENASKIVAALEPVTQLLDTQHRDSNALLEEARKASEEQRAATQEQVEDLKGTVASSLEYVGTSAKDAGDDMRKTVEGAMSDLAKAQDEAFGEMKIKTLKEHERTRDELQTDMLGFKNATSARLDSLESELSKAQDTIKQLEEKMAESADAASKKVLIPVYAAIAVGLIDLACLVMLLLR